MESALVDGSDSEIRMDARGDVGRHDQQGR